MFHSLLINYKVLSCDHRCIYSEYKICLEKYWKVKKQLKETMIENKQIKKELARLRTEMESDEQIEPCLPKIQQAVSADQYIINIQEESDDCENNYESDMFELV
jgi:predicted metal-binding transcription factor (methanogenesis marker protein 9)